MMLLGNWNLKWHLSLQVSIQLIGIVDEEEIIWIMLFIFILFCGIFHLVHISFSIQTQTQYLLVQWSKIYTKYIHFSKEKKDTWNILNTMSIFIWIHFWSALHTIDCFILINYNWMKRHTIVFYNILDSYLLQAT